MRWLTGEEGHHPLRLHGWVVIVTAIAALTATGLMVNGNILYEAGAVKVSGYSAAETFTHRPITFRLLSAVQSWLPDRLSVLLGPPTSWRSVLVYIGSFRLVSMVIAAGASALLWCGLRRVWGSMAGSYGVAAFAALAFTAPATGEPDWMAACLTVAGVGTSLLGRPAVGASLGGVLFALAALVKISTLPVAVAGLVVLWAVDRRRGWIACAAAFVTGLIAVGLIWWLAPWEIDWLWDIRALQPNPWTAEHALEAGDYVVNLAARWPPVALVPAFFIGAARTERWTALVVLALTAFSIAYQGQYFVYHAISLVTVAAGLAVRTLERSRGRLRWQFFAATGWAFLLLLIPAPIRLDHPLRSSLVTLALVVWLTVAQWRALRRPPRLSRYRSSWWAALLVIASMLATQTPFSAESVTLSTASRTSAKRQVAFHWNVLAAQQVHEVIGGTTQVAYLTFGADTFLLGNPTHCRYPSPLFLQRKDAPELVSPATRQENLACLTDPGARWLIWNRDWLHRSTAPADLVNTIDVTWACEDARVIGAWTICPRRA